MPAFYYDAISDSRTNSFRRFLALCNTDQVTAAGIAVLDTSVGAQAITGVGFQPELVGIIGVGLAEEDESLPGWEARGSAFHVGFGDGTDQWAGSLAGQFNQFAWSADRHSYWRTDRIITMQGVGSHAPVESFSASLDSLDTDGFTLAIDVAPTKGVRFIWFCAAGAAGGYKVGTSAIPGGTGNQAINGLGFQPSGIFFANGPGQLGVQDHEWIGLGGSDGTDDFSVWAGARKGVPYLTMRNDAGKCITFAQSSTGSGGAGRQVVAQAEMVSLEADGFLLNWTTVAISGYYHWVAAGADADVDEFLFDPTANDKEVPTLYNPVGIIGFGNDQIEDGWEPSRNAAALGMSFCGTDVADEWSASFHEGYPSTLAITANRRSIKGGSFGAYSIASSLNGAHRNLCDIVLFTEEPRIPGLNWRYAQRQGVATRALLGDV